MGGLVVEPSRVLWHRLRVNHLARRAPAGAFSTAAFAGLQDSAPRAALTALYARVEDVGSSAWEDPSLVQTWAPRGAVFVVPRSDLAVFASGMTPRDPDLRRALELLASRARDSISQPRRDEGPAEHARLGPLPPVVRGRRGRRPVSPQSGAASVGVYRARAARRRRRRGLGPKSGPRHDPCARIARQEQRQEIEAEALRMPIPATAPDVVWSSR